MVLDTEYIFYCKRAILILSSSKILTPIPLSARRVCFPPAPKAGGGGGTHSPGGEGDGGSIFWKTKEIGLPSYSKICTLWIQEYELGIEAAEKKACWDLANIWFGNRRRKSSQIVYDDICLLVQLVTILFAQPIGTERLGGIKKAKGTHYSRFSLEMLIFIPLVLILKVVLVH